jgi:hypothetical protein
MDYAEGGRGWINWEVSLFICSPNTLMFPPKLQTLYFEVRHCSTWHLCQQYYIVTSGVSSDVWKQWHVTGNQTAHRLWSPVKKNHNSHFPYTVSLSYPTIVSSQQTQYNSYAVRFSVQITAASHVKFDCGVGVADVGNTFCHILVIFGDSASKSDQTVSWGMLVWNSKIPWRLFKFIIKQYSFNPLTPNDL